MESSSPQHASDSPIYAYSTLEAAHASHFQTESTLEPVPVYQANDYPLKEAYQKVDVHAEDSEAGRSDAGNAGGTHRGICGMKVAVAILYAVIVLLVIVGGVVGGVVESYKEDGGGLSEKADSSSTSSMSSASSTSSSTTGTTSTTSTSSPIPSFLTEVPDHLFYSNRWNSLAATVGKREKWHTLGPSRFLGQGPLDQSSSSQTHNGSNPRRPATATLLRPGSLAKRNHGSTKGLLQPSRNHRPHILDMAPFSTLVVTSSPFFSWTMPRCWLGANAPLSKSPLTRTGTAAGTRQTFTEPHSASRPRSITFPCGELDIAEAIGIFSIETHGISSLLHGSAVP